MADGAFAHVVLASRSPVGLASANVTDASYHDRLFSSTAPSATMRQMRLRSGLRIGPVCEEHRSTGRCQKEKRSTCGTLDTA